MSPAVPPGVVSGVPPTELSTFPLVVSLGMSGVTAAGAALPGGVFGLGLSPRGLHAVTSDTNPARINLRIESSGSSGF